MSKLFQLITARSEVCLTVIVLPLLPMATWPAAPLPPVGNWFDAGGAAMAAPPVSMTTVVTARVMRVTDCCLPWDFAVSLTTTQVIRALLQITLKIRLSECVMANSGDVIYLVCWLDCLSRQSAG